MQDTLPQTREPIPAQGDLWRPVPRVFIGSSKKGLPIAEYVQAELGENIEGTVWSQSFFPLTAGTLESLDLQARQYDFAILILTPDDLRVKEDRSSLTPRDNVVLELGLFIGKLGRQRTFIVKPSDQVIDIPSDIAGVTVATYHAHRRDRNLRAAVGPACRQIKDRVSSIYGLYEHRCDHVPRPRRRLSLGVACPAGPRTNFRIINISETGAFLETRGEIREGNLLDLHLELDNGKKAWVTARVARVQTPDWGRIGGVGVAFTEWKGDAREVIREFVGLEQNN